MTYTFPRCQECNSRRRDAIVCYRLDPVNWHERRAVMCSVCRAKLRYTAVTFDRPYVERVPR